MSRPFKTLWALPSVFYAKNIETFIANFTIIKGLTRAKEVVLETREDIQEANEVRVQTREARRGQ